MIKTEDKDEINHWEKCTKCNDIRNKEEHKITTWTDNGDGTISLTDGCSVAGLGGQKNYRDGSYEYYIHEPVQDNDPKAVGPFIMLSLLVEN